MAVVISLDSEPRTGKSVLAKLLVDKMGFKHGNIELSETLLKNVSSDFTSWTFESCLAKILSVVPTRNNRVVYIGLNTKHTLLNSLWELKAIDEREYGILNQCCEIFLEPITCDYVVYSSGDYNALSSFFDTGNRHDSKSVFFGLTQMAVVKRVYKRCMDSLSNVVPINSEHNFNDGVIQDRVLNVFAGLVPQS